MIKVHGKDVNEAALFGFLPCETAITIDEEFAEGELTKTISLADIGKLMERGEKLAGIINFNRIVTTDGRSYFVKDKNNKRYKIYGNESSIVVFNIAAEETCSTNIILINSGLTPEQYPGLPNVFLWENDIIIPENNYYGQDEFDTTDIENEIIESELSGKAKYITGKGSIDQVVVRSITKGWKVDKTFLNGFSESIVSSNAALYTGETVVSSVADTFGGVSRTPNPMTVSMGSMSVCQCGCNGTGHSNSQTFPTLAASLMKPAPSPISKPKTAGDVARNISSIMKSHGNIIEEDNFKYNIAEALITDLTSKSNGLIALVDNKRVNGLSILTFMVNGIYKQITIDENGAIFNSVPKFFIVGIDDNTFYTAYPGTPMYRLIDNYGRINCPEIAEFLLNNREATRLYDKSKSNAIIMCAPVMRMIIGRTDDDRVLKFSDMLIKTCSNSSILKEIKDTYKTESLIFELVQILDNDKIIIKSIPYNDGAVGFSMLIDIAKNQASFIA